jgi:hypothetical protein
MAITKVTRTLLSTGIVDNSNATAITIDSSENVGIGTTSPTGYYSGADNLVIYQSSGETGITIATATNTTGALYFADGTTGSQAYQGGIAYSHGAEILNLVAGGTNKMTVTSTGNVGIGTSSPSQPLTVSKAGDLYIQVNNSSAGFNTYLGTYTNESRIVCDGAKPIAFFVNGSRVVDFANGGNVGIGTSSPSAKLEVIHGNVSQGNGVSFGRTASQSWDFWGDSGANVLYSKGNFAIIGTSDSQDLSFRTNNTDRMRIGASGRVLINRTSSASTNGRLDILRSSGEHCINCEVAGTASSTLVGFFNGNGFVGGINTSGSATSYNTSSDYRLKENVDYDFTALDRVAQLKPARFNFIADADTTVDGFIAHEVQDIVPEAVTGEKDAVDDEGNPEYQGIDQSKLVPLLTKAIQEQQTIIDDLKTRIETLENV